MDIQGRCLQRHINNLHPEEIGQLRIDFFSPTPKRASGPWRSVVGPPPVDCPVHFCPYDASTATNLFRHFTARHMEDDLSIAGYPGYNKCPRCQQYVKGQEPTARHQNLVMCHQGKKEMRGRSVYSSACEQIPHDIPKPIGNHVQTTHYVDANLHHDIATGKAVAAVLHFLNQTPIDAYTKRQFTVETATYGSDFVAARTAVDQIIDIRTTLRYVGVPIRDKSYMFRDNRSVVTSSTIPSSTISKRHHLASYHRVREAIAAKYISFHWKDGKSNPADILSNHWEFATVWPMLKPIQFWRGETATQLKVSDRIPSTTPGT